ncbi:MAG: hypothetical protein ACLQIB_12500 [Isosphaeraceae bacterium]
MNFTKRSQRVRSVRPVLAPLEGRELLNAALPHDLGRLRAAAHVLEVKHQAVTEAKKHVGPTISNIVKVDSHGFQFTNFNGPNAGNTAGLGTNENGIANNGTSVGVSLENNGDLLNFTTNPLKSNSATTLNINGSTTAMAFAANSSGTVVGTDGNNNAFLEKNGKVTTFIPLGGTSALAFGINDGGTIVGQYTNQAGVTPGFIRVNNKSFVTIDAPSGTTTTTVNAQGINNKGLVVGFYVGMDGNDHGFILNAKGAKKGTLTGVAVTDPTIPVVPGEPAGTTFVFSQILGINDKGIAVGYYGDSTASQHGFIYNTKTGQYTFLDDPSEAFCNGVEVTQITGITNSGEITGFYSDANGVFHGFVAKA